jgi:four helix bundle protein
VAKGSRAGRRSLQDYRLISPRGDLRLVSQIRRSAVSVPSNIAEGQGRATKGEFIQFLCHARGSLFELQTQLIIAAKLKYLDPEQENRLLEESTEVARILNGLLTSLGLSSRKP